MKNTMKAFHVLALAVAGFAACSLQAQDKAAAAATPAARKGYELGASFTYKRAQVASPALSKFGIYGGALDGVKWLPGHLSHLGAAFDFSAEAAGTIAPGVSLQQFSLVGGPRVSLLGARTKARGYDLYATALGGFVHGNHSLFVSSGTNPTVSYSASAMAAQFGGGLIVPLHLQKSSMQPRFGWKVFEADYVLTGLPNNSDNLQHDLRLSTGFVMKF